MADPTDKVAELNELIDDGVRQVTIDGQTTTYNTTDSLIRARDDAKARALAEEAKVANPARRLSRRTMLFHGGRGY